MSVAPIYKAYTLAELQDAMLHIDQQKFPERVKEIEKYIAERYESGDIESHFAVKKKDIKNS